MINMARTSKYWNIKKGYGVFKKGKIVAFRSSKTRAKAFVDIRK